MVAGNFKGSGHHTVMPFLQRPLPAACMALPQTFAKYMTKQPLAQARRALAAILIIATGPLKPVAALPAAAQLSRPAGQQPVQLRREGMSKRVAQNGKLFHSKSSSFPSVRGYTENSLAYPGGHDKIFGRKNQKRALFL